MLPGQKNDIKDRYRGRRQEKKGGIDKTLKSIWMD